MKRRHRLRWMSAAITVAAAAVLIVVTPPLLQRWRMAAARRFVAAHAAPTRWPLGVFEWRDAGALAQLPAYGRALQTLHRGGYGTVDIALNYTALTQTPQPYKQSLETFAAAVGRAGLRVGAVAGDPSWANAAGRPALAAVLQFVDAYDRAAPQPFARLQLDIEPYVHAPMSATTLSAQLASAARTAALTQQAQHSRLAIGLTVPFWLADGSASLGSVLRAVAGLPHGFITVMDYRRTAFGHDGAIAHAAPFFASAARQQVGVVIAEDATPGQPAKTTFAGRSSADLRAAQHLLDQTFIRQNAYAGQEVNDLQSLYLGT